MKKVKIIAWCTIGLSLLLGFGTLFGSGLEFIAALNSAETIALVVLHAGICTLFFMGGRAFTTDFRRAFGFVAGGIVLLALAVLQYTVLGSANALDSFWVTSGAIEVAFILSILALLIGQGGFARLMGVPHLSRYIWLSIGAALIAAAVATQLPSPRTDIESGTLFVTSALYTFQAVMLIAFLPLAYRIRRKAGALYVPLFAWLFAAWAVYALQLVVTVYGLFFFADNSWYVTYGATMVFFFSAGLCLLKAAVELNRIRFSEPPVRFTQLSFFGKPKQRTEDQGSSAVEAVTYLAGLSSNIEAIDSILDGLRDITVITTPGQILTEQQQQKLSAVYLRLEETLATQEKIGRFNRTSVRELVIRRFQDPKDAVFWGSLSENPAEVAKI